MAKRILVPIDGRDEPDALVDLIADAAQSGAVVRLLHVASLPEVVRDVNGHVVAYVDQETARLEREANAMLAAVATRFGGATVEQVVRFGEPITEILLESDAFGADLIAMAARRPYRLAHFVLGTTADQVCRRTDVPVVIMRPAPARP